MRTEPADDWSDGNSRWWGESSHRQPPRQQPAPAQPVPPTPPAGQAPAYPPAGQAPAYPYGEQPAYGQPYGEPTSYGQPYGQTPTPSGHAHAPQPGAAPYPPSYGTSLVGPPAGPPSPAAPAALPPAGPPPVAARHAAEPEPAAPSFDQTWSAFQSGAFRQVGTGTGTHSPAGTQPGAGAPRAGGMTGGYPQVGGQTGAYPQVGGQTGGYPQVGGPTGAHPQVGGPTGTQAHIGPDRLRRPGPPGRPEPGRQEPFDRPQPRTGASAGPPPGHVHGSGSGAPGSRRTARIMTWILIPLALATAVGMILMWPGKPQIPAQSSDGQPYVRASGQVLAITVEQCPDTTALIGGPAMPCGTAVVAVKSGPGTGTSVNVDLPQGAGSPRVAVGDQVVLSYNQDPTGTNPPKYYIVDHERGRQLLTILGLVCVVIVIFGRWRGLTALVGLAVSFAVLLLFVIPAILNGASPLLVAIIGASAAMFAVLYLTHGFSVHTSVAVMGTLASLVLTGLLGWAFTVSAALTGFNSDETLYVSILNSNVDMRGLLLAGIIIGALGVLDDVTVTQASTVAELAPTAGSRRALFGSATRIGRAHVASAVNTLVLAYAGTSLPLLLLVYAGGQSITNLLTSQVLATEIVRAAIGTLGLVAAVPITTGLATLVADIRHRPDHERSNPNRHGNDRHGNDRHGDDRHGDDRERYGRVDGRA